MSGESAYYCVIQYCPDRGREESANVGVLLFAPAAEFVRARVAPMTARARGFFGLGRGEAADPNSAAAALAHLVNSGAARIESLDDLRAFVATRANDIRLTEPRVMRTDNVTADLDELFYDLVEAAPPPTTTAPRESRPLVPPKLHAVFTRLSVLGRVRTPGKVRVPVLGRELDIPYAYQNGVLNLVKPQVFEAGKKSENRAERLALEGNLIDKHEDDGKRRLIVVAGPGSTPEGEEHAAKLLREFEVEFVPQAEADQFAETVERDAH